MKKKHTAQFGSFSLQLVLCSAAVCSIITGTLLAFFHPEAPAEASHPAGARLTFAQRVAYQRAIEKIYWHHRIWPKSNASAKPPLDKVMSQTQLEKKVADYLRGSQVLEDYWQRPITSQQLQAEMDRMAQRTKQPEVLRELFATLGNDPFVIAECLARSALAERLLTELNDRDRVELTTVGWLTDPVQSRIVTAETHAPKKVAAIDSIAKAVQVNRPYHLPVIASSPGGCTDDTWTPTTITNAPDDRGDHTTVWTGSEMIVWGGYDFAGSLNTGGKYNPSTDSWLATSSTNAPTARFVHTAVWTGSEMIVWGGSDNSTALNTGGRYNPSTDTWATTSTTNAPSGRYSHTAIWSGSEMIIWGGESYPTPFNTGGRYNPDTNSWTPTTTRNAPDARYWHTAVWTGSKMIVWGGWNASNSFNTGGTYNPGTNSWTATATTSAPDPRILHTAVWTGSEMIVWGGSVVGASNTGGRYNPDTNSWLVTSTTNAPSARVTHTAVWTGGEMMIWGGADCCNFLNTGGRYNPLTDSWTATAISNAPDARYDHTAVWSGSEMLVWGGDNSNVYFNTGGRYCAQSGAPSPTPTPTATSMPCHVSSAACGGVITGTAPTDFVLNVSDPVFPLTVDPTDFTVNGTPANAFALQNGNMTIVFHFNTTPVTQGLNTMHISAGAFNCVNGPVAEFNCTFTYETSTPTPTPTATHTPTATPTSTPTATATFTPRPSPTPRVVPTPRPRPTPPPRP